MSYYSEMTPEARKKFYEKQKCYRSAKKNCCLVFPRWCHDAIKGAADKVGVSVTRFMVLSSLRMVCDIKEHGVDYFNNMFGREGFYYVQD